MSDTPKSDRFVLFSDAVVAIAITLLILPLVDAVPEAIAKHEHASEVITENWRLILSFLLSFAVISRFWLVHHRLFEHVDVYPRPLISVNLVWLLSIVVMPLPTEMLGSYQDRFTATFYIGTLVVGSACILAMTFIVHRAGNTDATSGEVRAAIGTTGLFVLAFLLAALIPGVGLWAMLTLLLLPVVGVFGRRSARQQVGAAEDYKPRT